MWLHRLQEESGKVVERLQGPGGAGHPAPGHLSEVAREEQLSMAADSTAIQWLCAAYGQEDQNRRNSML